MLVKLMVMHGPSTGKEIKIAKDQFFIGRGDECHLRPKSDAISRRHCVIIVNETQVMIRDLGSKNGTIVNGDRIEGDRVLKVGDYLKVGPLEFQVMIDHGIGGGDKRPKVNSIKDAATRAFDSSVVDTDVGSWLEEMDDIEKARRAADPSTRQFNIADVGVESEKLDTKELPNPETESIKASGDETAKTRVPEKKPPGKLPVRPDAVGGENSRDAAAEMLKKFFNRR